MSISQPPPSPPKWGGKNNLEKVKQRFCLQNLVGLLTALELKLKKLLLFGLLTNFSVKVPCAISQLNISSLLLPKEKEQILLKASKMPIFFKEGYQ